MVQEGGRQSGGCYVLTHFQDRCLAELPRMVLAMAGVEWKSEIVRNHKEFQAFVHDSNKSLYGLLPVLKTPEGQYISESLAIVQHLAQEFNLAGQGEDKTRLIEIMSASYDILTRHLGMIPLLEEGSEHQKRLKCNLVKNTHRYFRGWERLLNNCDEKGCFLLGSNNLTVADLAAFRVLEEILEYKVFEDKEGGGQLGSRQGVGSEQQVGGQQMGQQLGGQQGFSGQQVGGQQKGQQAGGQQMGQQAGGQQMGQQVRGQQMGQQSGGQQSSSGQREQGSCQLGGACMAAMDSVLPKDQFPKLREWFCAVKQDESLKSYLESSDRLPSPADPRVAKEIRRNAVEILGRDVTLD